MIVTIDTDSTVPVYEQLESQMQRLIASGQLKVGTRLPTIRGLAKDLGLATATVSRAYEHLADGGWVTANGRRGTIVSGSFPDTDFRQQLATEFAAVIEKARQVGLTNEEIQTLLRSKL